MIYYQDCLILTFIYSLFLFPRFRAQGRRALLIKTGFFLYVGFVLYHTLFPVWNNLPALFSHTYRPMNMNPFVDIIEGHSNALQEVFLNMLITLPFGMAMNRIYGKGPGECILLTLIFSLSIELLQPLISTSRISDITDVITNTLGGAAGWYLAEFFTQQRFRR
ncbi:MAG: VanZ family protein [Solobacterium sp.]|nr:VanZ family protein [Solobacterium sp.]